MSKLFHCRCAVAIKFAKTDKIIAFDESHIEDVRVSLSGFATAFGTLQGTHNPSFPGGRYVTPDNTVSVTLNETVLDASWLAMLDVGYTQVGGKGSDFARNLDGLESIYGIDNNQIQEAISVKASQMISDPAFSSEKGKALILEAQGKGDISPNTGNPQEEQISKISDPTIFKDKLKEFINKAETTKDSTTLSTAKKQIGLLLTAGRKNGLVPDIGNTIPPTTKPQESTQKPPATVTQQESYGTIVLAMDHSPSGFGSGADGKERQKTDVIAQYIKSEIERKEPKIRVEIVRPEDKVKGGFTPGGGTDSECGPYDKAWDPYDNYIINNFVKNTKSKATIISVHLDAPKGGSGGFGARVWNLQNATNISNKLTNVIQGTYVSKFKEINDQSKENSIGRWNRCDIRSARIFQDAPEGYALLEFGVFRGIKDINQFIKSDQKQAFDALIDGLIQFKRNNGSSTDVPNAADPNTGESNQANEQNSLQNVTEKPGILISFWYDVNNYIAKVDYYFALTSASVLFGDGPPRLNLSGVSAYSVVFNTWRMQDSFSAGSPIDEVIKKIFSSDPTKTFDRSKVEFDKEVPNERLYSQEDLAGLTYSEFKAKLASKFDLQFLANPRVDQLGKIKVFRESRGTIFSGSQVFWLGRGLFEKFDISVVSDFTARNLLRDQNSSYSDASTPATALSPGSPFKSTDRVEFNKVPNQPSMIQTYNGSSYTNMGLPPSGWERGQNKAPGPGIQVVLKLPNGTIWPKNGNFEIHSIAENRGEAFYSITRSMAVWDPSSKTFVIKSGKLHTALDGGVTPGGELISYFKGEVIYESANYGEVVIKYNRFISLSINGKADEYQLFQRTLHMTNRVKKGTIVDIGTKIGNQGNIGANGAPQYDNHCHEEFYINTPNGKTLYLDPFIVYNYSYSKDSSGNRTFDSAARINSAPTGSNNLNPGFQGGAANQVNEQFLLKTEFAGIPRALQILPGQTFLHFVTDYNTYLSVPNDNKANVDPGIPIINQLKDWMIYRCSFNWSGDLRISLDCYRPRNPKPIYAGQNWQSYRESPAGKKPSLDDYYDYMRSIGDLSYITIDENGNIVNSFNSQFKADWLLTGGGQGTPAPSASNGKCKYTGNYFQRYKNNIDTIIAQLERVGFNKMGLAGVLGNISRESTFGTNIVGQGTCNGGDYSKATDASGRSVNLGPDDCWGIVQWGGGRRKAVLNKLNGNGTNIAGQADYVVEELRGAEKKCNSSAFNGNVVDLMNSASTPTKSAEIFRACYERGPGDPEGRGADAEIIFKGLTCQE